MGLYASEVLFKVIFRTLLNWDETETVTRWSRSFTDLPNPPGGVSETYSFGMVLVAGDCASPRRARRETSPAIIRRRGPPAGILFGPYEILAALGAGGMGEVYRARDTRLKRDVALKLLPASYASDPDRLARFQREAEVLASLNHPHIAQLYGVEHAARIRPARRRR